MKKIRTVLTGTMLVLSLSMLTACGNNGNNASDEVENSTENTNDNASDKNNRVDKPETETDRADQKDNAAKDNGDTMSEGAEKEPGDTAVTQEENDNNGDNVADDLGNGVKDLGDGVGDAVEDVGDAVGNVIDGDEQR